jgi:polyisoprenoid-binding protein YceI
MATTNWAVDPMHSEIHFKVRHLVISTVTGTFKKFSGTAVTEGEGFEDAKIEFTLDVDSIDTNQEQRDGHLKSADFFDAASYPEIKFVSTSFTKVDDDNYKLVGDLTMKGVTKPVELNAEFGGSAKDAWGNTKYGFEVTGKVNRKEFGLTYNALTETGGLALGEDIKFTANIQVAQAQAA